MKPTTIAAVQSGVTDGDPEANLARAATLLAEAGDLGADLTVFPEAFLSGYLLDSRPAVERAAVALDGPVFTELVGLVRRSGTVAVVGLLEKTGSGVHNAAVVIGHDGVLAVARKQHLPFLGADRFVDLPEARRLEVVDTSAGRVGVAICYELRFPEVARTLALRGADVLALPTGWPVESAILPDHFARVRAAENLMYLVAANRPDGGGERQFIGRSQIVDPLGAVQAIVDREETVISAVVDIARARDKRIVFDQDDFHVAPWSDRRPQIYEL